MRAAAASVLAVLGVVGSAHAAVPRIEQMVVFRSGKAVSSRARPLATSVRVGGGRCKVVARTPLALLARKPPAKLRLRDDFGSCPADAGGVYVVGIGPDEERGAGGWVYKVGRRAATAGAGNPSGPFGNGRLRKGQRVLWFYCRRATACQRTLSVRASIGSQGEVLVRVTGYDDNGDGVPVGGASVSVGPETATTGPDGRARVAVRPGRYGVVATKAGMVRSFRERVTVPALI